MTNCGHCFAKYLLCLFNLVFFLCGTFVLTLGVWLKLDQKSFVSFMRLSDKADDAPLNADIVNYTQADVITQLAYILIGVGAFIFFLSFLGYCGALQDSRCLLTLYGVLLLIAILIEIGAVVLAVVCKNKVETETKNILNETFIEYYGSNKDKDSIITSSWDKLMSQMHCCGIEDYNDFKNLPSFKDKDIQVPRACCVLQDNKLRDPDCMKQPTEANSYYKIGCYDTISNWIMDHMDWIIYTIGGLVIVQFLVIAFSYCMNKSYVAKVSAAC